MEKIIPQCSQKIKRFGGTLLLALLTYLLFRSKTNLHSETDHYFSFETIWEFFRLLSKTKDIFSSANFTTFVTAFSIIYLLKTSIGCIIMITGNKSFGFGLKSNFIDSTTLFAWLNLTEWVVFGFLFGFTPSVHYFASIIVLLLLNLPVLWLLFDQ